MSARQGRSARQRCARRLPLVALGVLAVCATGLTVAGLKAGAPAQSIEAGTQPDGPVITAPKVSGPVTVAFVGDSYTHGTGSSTPATRWTSLLSASLGWREVNLGRGGTGYVATGSLAACGLQHCPSYRDMIDDVVSVAPAMVVVAGGQNDFRAFGIDRQRVIDAIGSTFADLRARLPKAQIVAVGPSTPSVVNEEVEAFDEAVQASSKAVGGSYVSLINPNVITPSMLAPDRGHVNDLGHVAIAERVRAALH